MFQVIFQEPDNVHFIRNPEAWPSSFGFGGRVSAISFIFMGYLFYRSVNFYHRKIRVTCCVRACLHGIRVL